MEITIAKDVDVPMRDGVVLKADVYRPSGATGCPTLVSRQPYDKERFQQQNLFIDVTRAVRSGYAVVQQDTRGRFRSGGTFTPFEDEGSDGADTIAWAATQPWSSGRVGMIGGSYFGATQWLAATEAPPALHAVAPWVTVADYHEGWAYQGGAFALGFNLCWTLLALASGEVARRIGEGRATREVLAEVIRAADTNEELYWRLPLRDMPVLDGVSPYYFDWLAHPAHDDYWKRLAPKERYDRVTVPSLNVGGWYDCFLGGTLQSYRELKARAATPAARRPRLVVGPWSHGSYSAVFPERRYGIAASDVGADLTGLQLRWFDHHLCGEDNGADRDAPVRLFVMGANVWRDEDDWPLPDTAFTRYYLHSVGGANTAAGDGVLSTDAPGDEPDDVYLYDPRHPVPTVGGATFLPGLFVAANAGPRDQRAVEARHDVLCYTTAPLERAVEVTGPVELVLFASSSTLDTDFTGKLVDVHPDGRAEILTDGILRARYRDSSSEPSLLEPGRVYELHVDLWATANVFGAGHRIRLEVSSSNFPRYDRNTNTGGTIAEESEADLVPALNRVRHDARHPSHLVLPVIDRR